METTRSLHVVLLAIAVPLIGACSGAPTGSENGPSDEDLGQTSAALTNVCPPADNVAGIDIASFQHPGGAAINWTQVATARKFAFVKSTQGTGYTNPYYAADIASARAAGLVAGTYGVVAPQSKTGTTGAQQAQYFLAHSSIKPGDFPPLLDVEPFADYDSVLPEVGTVLSWLTTVEAALGRKPTVYIRPDLIADLGTPAALAAYTIDVPNYSTCPGFPNSYPVKQLIFWQYTDAAAVPGITGNVDGMRFYGDLTALKAFATGAPAVAPATGVLDKVACDGIAGWDWDPNQKTKSTTVQVSFNAPLGAAGSTVVSYEAADSRADLCKPLGTCTHAFAVTPPRSLFDAKAHSVDAYAVSLSGGAGDRLTSTPQSLNCPEIPIAAGAVKRHIPSPAVLTAWKMNAFTDMAPSTDAALALVTNAADLDAKPDCVIADDGSPSVWIIDQGKRRHVISPASMTAWRLTAVKLAAAMVNAIPQGPNWPATPELVKGAAPEVYVLDVAIDSPIVPVGDDGDAGAPGSPGSPNGPDGAQPDGDAPSDSSGGCSLASAGASSRSGSRSGSRENGWLFAAVLGAVVVAVRRKKRAVVAPAIAAALLAVPSAAAAAVTHPFTGVTEVNHGDRVLVVADLCAAGVSMRATKYAEREATPEQWATKATVNADVAINADFFDFPGWTYVVGRARGGGQDWPATEQNRENRSYWQFGPAIADFVEPASTAPSAGVTEIVGGHNVLIRNAKSLGPNFDGDSVITTLHRRTAIGIDATHGHVYLFASNVELDGTGVVSSVVQMAAEGGAPAVDFLTNQDGGGSSQMYVRGQGQIIDSGRQVNNHLGIFARGTGAAPMCPNRPPRGAFDAAACTSIAGWAQDQDAPTTPIDVHLYFGGPVGTAGVTIIPTVANIVRADLMTPIGSTNHGFDVPTPYGLFDNKPHNVFAYALDSKGGTNPLLGEKALTCAASAPAQAIRRHISSPAVLATWKFSMFSDAMPLADAAINAIAPGTDLAAAPLLVRADDKSPEVWLVDGPYRRHVISGASAAAWHFDLTKVVVQPAAMVNAMLHGPDLRERPLLARVTTGAVYVLDDPGALPPGAVVGPDGGVIVPGGDGSSGGAGSSGAGGGGEGGADGDAPSDDGGGCAVSAAPFDGAGAFATMGLCAMLTLLAGALRSRRK